MPGWRTWENQHLGLAPDITSSFKKSFNRVSESVYVIFLVLPRPLLLPLLLCFASLSPCRRPPSSAMVSSMVLLALPLALWHVGAAPLPASATAQGVDISTSLQNILSNSHGSDGYTYPTDLTRGITPVSTE